MDPIIGIDLGTTNSAVAIVEEGVPRVLHDDGGSAILPSVVGFSSDGQPLYGASARNQALIAPERTAKSIKRLMGQETKVRIADNEFSPQEVSAMILRQLKERAEAHLGRPVSKAVITVPAYFNEQQREATREAGELAGLQVMRIINEPTAAALTYQPHAAQNERLLIYDLGGGTFDVSVVQMEQGVIEVLASHGDVNLGGDDFDQLLLDHVCDEFEEEHEIDLRSIPVAKSRLLQGVERAKKELSDEAVVTIAEEFIAESEGKPLNLQVEITRPTYESLIESLVEKTIHCIDAALADAGLGATQLDRVILVGGSSRTPLVQELIKKRLGHDPHWEIDPDLCVAMGAAVQGALAAGVDVGTVLVDITPHTLGIRCVGELYGRMSDEFFSPVITRNTALPATRSRIYYTACDGQDAAQINVFQGEESDSKYNEPVGEFALEGLDEEAERGNEILVRFDLNLDGILTVTAIERATGLERRLRVDNAISRFRATDRGAAKEKLAAIFSEQPAYESAAAQGGVAIASPLQDAPDSLDLLVSETQSCLAKARRLIPLAPAEDAVEMRELVGAIENARSEGDETQWRARLDQLEDLLFYVEDV